MRHVRPQKKLPVRRRPYHLVDTEPLASAVIELPDWVAGAD